MKDVAQNYVALIDARIEKNLEKELKRRRGIAASLPEADGCRKKFLDDVREYEAQVRERKSFISSLAQASYPTACRIADPSIEEKELIRRLVAGAEWQYLELTQNKEAAS